MVYKQWVLLFPFLVPPARICLRGFYTLFRSSHLSNLVRVHFVMQGDQLFDRMDLAVGQIQAEPSGGAVWLGEEHFHPCYRIYPCLDGLIPLNS